MKNRIVLPIFLVMANQPTSILAAEYVLGAKFSPTFSYEDNVLLREDKDSSLVTKIQPTLQFSRAEANSTVALNTGLRIERYTDLKDLDREDPFANLSGNFNTERSSYGLSASYAERAQRSIADEDTGDFSSNTTVETINISPTYSYKLTEKDSLYSSYIYSDRTYAEGVNETEGLSRNNFNDNTTNTLTGGWQRSLTERLTGGIALTYSNYQSEGSQTSEYDTYNIAITSSYLLSEKWSLSGQVGYRTLENEITPELGPKETDESSGSLFSFSSSYNGEINDVSLSLARSLNPSGEGVVNEQDKISLNWRRSLTETLDFSINTSYQETRSADKVNSTDRKFLQFSPSLSWRMQEDISLLFGYQYREQKGTNVDAVDSNMVFITVGYDWSGLRFSR